MDLTLEGPKDGLFKTIINCLYAWVIYEYYNSYSMNVLLLRTLQIISVFRFKSFSNDPLKSRALFSIVLLIQTIIFIVQIFLSPTSPILIVFIGISHSPSALSIAMVDVIILCLFYILFTKTTSFDPFERGESQIADVEMGIPRAFRRRLQVS